MKGKFPRLTAMLMAVMSVFLSHGPRCIAPMLTPCLRMAAHASRTIPAIP